MFANLLVLIAVFVIAVNGEYKKIVSEECATLQSSGIQKINIYYISKRLLNFIFWFIITDNLFNQLLPCASYSSEPVEMACFAATEIPNALKTVPG